VSKITILLATYNGEKYIEPMIDSILNQSFTDWTLVLSDDGSKDKTTQVLDRYAQNYPEKILHYRSGIRFGCAQNHFMHLLSKFHESPYIMFCDQDDVWHKNKIEVTYNKMLETENDPTKPVLIHTDLRVVDGNLNEISPSFCRLSNLNGNKISLNNLLVQNVVTGCTVMLNKSLAELADLKTDSRVMMHDWWLAILAAACGKIDFLDEATIDYRQHGNNSVGASDNHSLVNIFNKIKSNKMRKTLKNAAIQAGLFLECFEDVLSEDTKRIIKDFSSTQHLGVLGRDIIYIKHKLLRQGFFSIVIQLLGL